MLKRKALVVFRPDKMVRHRALVLAVLLVAHACSKRVVFSNLNPRLTTTGEIANAHDGTTRLWNGSYWMHAAAYHHGPDPAKHGGAPGYDIVNNHNISIWRSSDLSSGSWEFMERLAVSFLVRLHVRRV